MDSLAPYESPEDSFEEEEEEVPRKRAAKRSLQWDYVQTFPDPAAALVFIKDEKIWSINYTNYSTEGKKVYYRCNQVKRRGPQCDAALHLLYDSTNLSVLLFSTGADHTCNKLKQEQQTQRLSEEMKSKIEELFDYRMKPKRIFEELCKLNLKPKNLDQISNYVRKLKLQRYGEATISLHELDQWCSFHSKVPEDEDEGYVVAYRIHGQVDSEDSDDSDDGLFEDPSTKLSFNVIISTKRLIQQSSQVHVVHTDATYKLNWEGYPVIVVGTSDSNKKFHPICLSVSSDETKLSFQYVFQTLLQEAPTLKPTNLVADASVAIREALTRLLASDGTPLILSKK